MTAHPHISIRSDTRGFALESAVFTMVIATAVMAVLLSAAITTWRTTSMEIGNARAMYAAEAASEAALAQVMRAVEDGYLSDDDLASISPPDLKGFSFDSFAVTREGGAVMEAITDGTFAGLSSLTQRVNIHAEAHDPLGNSGAVVVSAKAQAIPIFQFGAFYEEDLEITNGPPLTFEGWVHTNGNLYLSSDNAWYKEQVTVARSVFWDRKDEHKALPGVYIADASGTDVALDFDSRSHPAADDFRSRSAVQFDTRLKTSAHGVKPLQVPLPDGVTPHELIRPREASDGGLEQTAKFAWKSDFHVSLDLDHPTLLIPGASGCAAMTVTRANGRAVPALGNCRKFFNYDDEAFMDGRENRTVDALTLYVDSLHAWVAADPAKHAASIVYVEFRGSGAARDASGDGVFPAVRVRGGSTLTSPLTVATAWPLYVQGNFNSVGWQPAALVGDAITILSNAWTDAAHAGPTWPGLTGAAPTAVYAAILAGHSATPCDHEEAGCGAIAPYGGGLENFPRFLEDWSGVALTYRGSLVSLYQAQRATEPWGYGVYYEAPTRDWRFDTRFRDPANLPPGTPVVGNVLHTAFRPVH